MTTSKSDICKKVVTAFRESARAKKVTAAMIVVYALVQGKPIWQGFSPIVNKTKLANGQRPWEGFSAAIYGGFGPQSPIRRFLREAGLDEADAESLIVTMRAQGGALLANNASELIEAYAARQAQE